MLLDSKWRDTRDNSILFVSEVDDDDLRGNVYLNGTLRDPMASFKVADLAEYFEAVR